MVEVIIDGGVNEFLTKRCTSEVLPTPCDPSMTILASRLLLIFEAVWDRRLEKVRMSVVS